MVAGCCIPSLALVNTVLMCCICSVPLPIPSLSSLCVHAQVSYQDGVSPMDADGDISWLPVAAAVDVPDDLYLQSKQLAASSVCLCAHLCCSASTCTHAPFVSCSVLPSQLRLHWQWS